MSLPSNNPPHARPAYTRARAATVVTRIIDTCRGNGDAGFVLPAAVIVLFVITVLAGTAIAVAVQSSKSTTRDTNVKSGLEAAEAGLQVAAYRLNQLKPTSSQCIAGSEVKTSESECKSPSEALGNGATYQYWTSLPLSTGAKCAGQTVAVKSGIVQRCVTAEATVNNIESTRLQTRIESAVGESLFAVSGILGLEEVKVSGSVKATAVVASNTKIKGEGSAAFEKGFEICPGGEFKPAAGTERNKSGVTVGGVGGMSSNPSFEITRSSGCPIEASLPAIHPTAIENDDIRIGTTDEFFTEGKSANKFTGSPKDELTLSSNSKLTLAGAKYYFCNMLAERNGELKIASGAKVEMFIDDNAGNKECPTTSGKFTIEGNAHLENPNGPGALLIMMRGKGPLTVANSGSLKASIYAPEAEIILSGAGTLTGAIVGKKVRLEAGAFIFGEESQTLVAQGSSGFSSRQAWQQCVPAKEPAKEAC
jgi:type II secretory pathway pseudopilin PulG